MSLSLSRVAVEAPKIDVFQILYCTEMEKQIQFGAQCCQKYALYENAFQTNVVNQQLFFEAFSHIMHIFGSVEPYSHFCTL